MNLWRNGVVIVLGFCVGFVAGHFFWRTVSTANALAGSLSPIEEKGTSYTFVHPLLGYRVPEATAFGDYVSLKNSLQKIADATKSTGNADRVSVYFRDLDAGLWVGIDQDATYHPASLLKVPTMIALYKEAEDDPALFSHTIVYDASVAPRSPIAAPSELINGHTYSIRDLVRYMITDSDNGAMATLVSRINPDLLSAVYTALGVKDPNDISTNANYEISARTYGLFFRVLYNTTYLSSDYSEQAMKLLSQATFADGLVAGVPAGTPVAHKYGDYVANQNNAVTGVELSDCGIVYYPAHSYLLCAMVSSGSEPIASKVIANISRTVYAAVQQRYATTTPQ